MLKVHQHKPSAPREVQKNVATAMSRRGRSSRYALLATQINLRMDAISKSQAFEAFEKLGGI